jgi:hypothetical protein
VAVLWPTAFDTFATNHQDGINETILAQTINDLALFANKAEIELGLLPMQGGIFINVKHPAFGGGAKGDGSDDLTPLTAAFNAVPASGANLVFPDGDYAVSGQLPCKSLTHVWGHHSPKYELTTNNTSTCKIRAHASWTTATSLFAPGGSTRGCSFHDISLTGNNIGTNVHCFRFPDRAAVTGEQSFEFHNVSVMGWTGNAFCGSLQVGYFSNVHVINNGLSGSGWGIDTSTGTSNRWVDCKLIGCMFSFNRAGNVYIGGANSATSGALEFTSCRFERAGMVQNPLTPANVDAPGVKIDNAVGVHFSNCTLDANTGDGYFITRIGGALGQLEGITISGGDCRRNGSGNSANNGGVLPERANFRFVGVDGSNVVQSIELTAVNSIVGKADDAGGGFNSPKWGVILDYAYYVDIIANRVEGVSQPYLFGPVGGLSQIWMPQVIDSRNGIFTIPVRSGAPTLVVADGSNYSAQLYFEASTNKIGVRVGAGWKYTAALV